jgi:hypothetical protein
VFEMSAEIIDIKAKRPPGNGAREALIEIGLQQGRSGNAPAYWAELVLMDLWARGFKVVPLTGDE